jgi:hypothetical protein
MLRWATLVAVSVSVSGCALGPIATPESSLLVTSVSQWGGTPPTERGTLHTVERITLHHQGVVWKTDGDVIAYLRRLQGWSRADKQWVDVPYHYIVAFDGTIYEGRPWHLAGDTNTQYDPRGHLLVMLMGNFEEQHPTDAQWQSAMSFVAEQMSRHKLPLSSLATHRDYAKDTLCPGKNFYDRMDEFRAQVARRLR